MLPFQVFLYVLNVVAGFVLGLGLYSLITGRILLNLGRPKQLSTPGAIRLSV